MGKLRVYFYLIFLFLALPCFGIEVKTALVIGNSKYEQLGTLSNTINDATAVNKALQEIGFKTTLITDQSEAAIRKSIRKFSTDSNNSDIALVYYAGHGAQVNGENYLLPSDIDIPKKETDIQLSSIKVDDLLNAINAKNKVIFLDACRDNPALYKNISKGRGGNNRGLAQANTDRLEDKSSGIFIAYATDSGNVALDGEGQKNSPFTKALLRHIKDPVSIDDMFSMVTKEVRQETKNTQKPYKYASLDGLLCLTGQCGSTQVLSNSSTTSFEKASKNSRIYLDKDWILVAVSAKNKEVIYLDPTTIKNSNHRTTVETLWIYEDQNDPVLKNFPSNTKSALSKFVFDCASNKAAEVESSVFDQNQNLINHVIFGAVDFLPLITDYSSSGSIGHMIIETSCNDSYRKTLLQKLPMQEPNWTVIYTTIGSRADVYINNNTIKNDGNFKTVDVGYKLREPAPINQLKIYGDLNYDLGLSGVVNVPKITYLIHKAKIDCSNNTGSYFLDQYYDQDGKVKYFNLLNVKISSNPLTFEKSNPFFQVVNYLCTK